MNDFFGHPYFKEFAVPLLAVFITIGVKVVSKRDSHLYIKQADFAIGFDLIVNSLLLLVTYSSNLAIDLHENKAVDKEMCQRKLEYLPWILFLSVVALWSLSTIVRKYGWDSTNPTQPRLMWGIWIPTLLGLIALLLTVNFIE